MVAEPHPISLGRVAQLDPIFVGLIVEPDPIVLGGGQVRLNNTF
jgi:hypothetical protein